MGYEALFDTPLGTFTFVLLLEEEPKAASSFIDLAAKGFYNGMILFPTALEDLQDLLVLRLGSATTGLQLVDKAKTSFQNKKTGATEFRNEAGDVETASQGGQLRSASLYYCPRGRSDNAPRGRSDIGGARHYISTGLPADAGFEFVSPSLVRIGRPKDQKDKDFIRSLAGANRHNKLMVSVRMQQSESVPIPMMDIGEAIKDIRFLEAENAWLNTTLQQSRDAATASQQEMLRVNAKLEEALEHRCAADDSAAAAQEALRTENAELRRRLATVLEQSKDAEAAAIVSTHAVQAECKELKTKLEDAEASALASKQEAEAQVEEIQAALQESRDAEAEALDAQRTLEAEVAKLKETLLASQAEHAEVLTVQQNLREENSKLMETQQAMQAYVDRLEDELQQSRNAEAALQAAEAEARASRQELQQQNERLQASGRELQSETDRLQEALQKSIQAEAASKDSEAKALTAQQDSEVQNARLKMSSRAMQVEIDRLRGDLEQSKKIEAARFSSLQALTEQNAKLERETEKLNRSAVPLPSHWSSEELDQGWKLSPVTGDVLDTLKELFKVTQPSELGAGRDASKYYRAYNNLEVHCAWQVEFPALYMRYTSERNLIARGMRRATACGVSASGFVSRLHKTAMKLPGTLDASCGETVMLHGTKPQHLLALLDSGMKDRLSSGLGNMFGGGLYLGEDPEKIDQYTLPDTKYEQPGMEGLHARLFRAGGNSHPDDDLFYCAVVRAAAGLPFHSTGLLTKDYKIADPSKGEVGQIDVQTKQEVFKNVDRRELADIPGVSPPLAYNSLAMHVGKALQRFRELVIFTDKAVYVDYIVAYKRVRTP
eukprot:TRINITY_DN38448_c0_g3_i1.p1 TRINITY_DN38448_c0_g3~~TRINITY_DN38448_c0_g3_i1.p1  ORF type:complete len:835 (+),score=209.77 TRINITY_DN38448_c0_g3_i1:101-2605(+)